MHSCHDSSVTTLLFYLPHEICTIFENEWHWHEGSFYPLFFSSPFLFSIYEVTHSRIPNRYSFTEWMKLLVNRNRSWLWKQKESRSMSFNPVLKKVTAVHKENEWMSFFDFYFLRFLALLLSRICAFVDTVFSPALVPEKFNFLISFLLLWHFWSIVLAEERGSVELTTFT